MPVDWTDIPDRGRGQRQKFSHPARHAQALNTSGAGIVHREMMDLQSQPNLSGGDVDRLKHLRRDWNRNRKYTDAGMAIADASTPLEAQDAYTSMSGDFRGVNKQAFNKMYPLTGAYHHYADVGGLAGLAYKGGLNALQKIGELGSSIIDRTGIFGTSKASDEATPENVENYLEKTFPSDVHPGTAYAYEHPDDMGLYDDEEVYGGPMPHDDMPYLSDEAAAIQKEFNTNPYFRDLAGENVVLPYEKERRGHPHLETYVPDPEVFGETSVINEPLPMDLESRQMGRQNLKPNKYENEFRDYIESGGELIPYHEFERAYEKIYQGKPHALHSSYR